MPLPEGPGARLPHWKLAGRVGNCTEGRCSAVGLPNAPAANGTRCPEVPCVPRTLDIAPWSSVAPQVLETRGRQLGVAHGVLNVAVAEVWCACRCSGWRFYCPNRWLVATSARCDFVIDFRSFSLDLSLKDALLRQRTFSLPADSPRHDASPWVIFLSATRRR